MPISSPKKVLKLSDTHESDELGTNNTLVASYPHPSPTTPPLSVAPLESKKLQTLSFEIVTSKPKNLSEDSEENDTVQNQVGEQAEPNFELKAAADNSILVGENSEKTPSLSSSPRKISQSDNSLSTNKLPSPENVSTPQFLDSPKSNGLALSSSQANFSNYQVPPSNKNYLAQQNSDFFASGRQKRELKGNFSPMQKKRKLKDKNCFQCGGKGHFNRLCPSPRGSLNNPFISVVCSGCQGKGHRITACPTAGRQQFSNQAQIFSNQRTMYSIGVATTDPKNPAAYANNVNQIFPAPSHGVYNSQNTFKSSYKPSPVYGNDGTQYNYGLQGYYNSPPNYSQYSQQVYPRYPNQANLNFHSSNPGQNPYSNPVLQNHQPFPQNQTYSPAPYGFPPHPNQVPYYPIEQSYATRVKPAPNNNLCFRCHQPGHWARECPLAPPLESEDACWRCRKRGHHARDCKTCLKCNQEGHSARNCSNMGVNYNSAKS